MKYFLMYLLVFKNSKVGLLVLDGGNKTSNDAWDKDLQEIKEFSNHQILSNYKDNAVINDQLLKGIKQLICSMGVPTIQKDKTTETEKGREMEKEPEGGNKTDSTLTSTDSTLASTSNVADILVEPINATKETTKEEAATAIEASPTGAGFNYFHNLKFYYSLLLILLLGTI